MDSRRQSVPTFAAALAGIVALLLAGLHSPAFADNFRGPVKATVINVLDGDTFLADAHIWPGQSLRVNVRIRGIDAPEMKSRCDAEHLAALRARDALSSLVQGDAVLISNIGGAKYYGRVLADVETAKGEAIGPALIEQRLVRRYFGGKRDSWCG